MTFFMKKALAIPLLLLSTSASSFAQNSDNNADLRFWAPGMGNSDIHLTQVQGGGPGPQYIGNYWAYVIKGFSGVLTLGNRNNNDEYWEPSKSYQRSWNGQSSWATFGFQINYQAYASDLLHLAVSGTEAGASTGAITTLLPQPLAIISRGNWDTSITFVPHVNPYFLPAGRGVSNKTPSGGMIILADIYTKPPEPTGQITLSKAWVFPTESVTVSYNYDQGEDALREGSSTLGGLAPFTISGGS